MDGNTPVGVVGAGTMGTGIAQVAASAGHETRVFDADRAALERSEASLRKVLDRLVEKGTLGAAEAGAIRRRVRFVDEVGGLGGSGLVVEAVVEDLGVKRALFAALEAVVARECVLATNTSSLSIASIASACAAPARVLGLHFFNPAPLMPLVEVVPGVRTDADVASRARSLVGAWGKTTVVAADTPGFIVNRVARPFYGESLRILEEGIADAATIDWAMKTFGGFRMGPFELMDLIGHDVNYAVTESVFAAFFHDPRYKPSLAQKRLVEAGLLGRKSGRGFFDYADGAVNPKPREDEGLGRRVLTRVLAMLINEAADALFWRIATREDIDLAVVKGVNYPRGLLQWADEIGVERVLGTLCGLQDEYGEDRYRPSPLLRRMVREGTTFTGR